MYSSLPLRHNYTISVTVLYVHHIYITWRHAPNSSPLYNLLNTWQVMYMNLHITVCLYLSQYAIYISQYPVHSYTLQHFHTVQRSAYVQCHTPPPRRMGVCIAQSLRSPGLLVSFLLLLRAFISWNIIHIF